MAQWSRADRTLYTKLVYYGPAFGGKTTNLESLHRITDPQEVNRLLSLQTVNDRTLFFDLLPFELGDILGYQVAMKIYTVPGQVRYDTTRQVVLAGTDAVVFVADSSSDRRDQNVWSLQNLRMNMRAKRLDPSRIPILFQFNKQDLPCAAPVHDVATWLGVSPERGIPAVATEGRGVLETYMAACRAMLESLVARADARTRREIDPAELARQLERAFAPHQARRDQGAVPPPKPQPDAAPEAQVPMVLEGDELLERSVQTSVRLGEKLTTEAARAARLEREAEAFRRLSDSLRSVGASFERGQIIDTTLEATQQILEAPVVSLIREISAGQVTEERVWGTPADPLLTFDGGVQ
jgi:signal recognition particle receptor subunit beta